MTHDARNYVNDKNKFQDKFVLIEGDAFKSLKQKHCLNINQII